MGDGLAALRIVEDARRWAFDADAHDFLLALAVVAKRL